MILGIGTDLCSIDRIAGSLDRLGERFAARIFTPAERAYADAAQVNRAARYAKRFAAKEATAKALGTGFRDGLAFSDIEVVRLPSGRPTLRLSGPAAAAAEAMLPPGHTLDIHLSLTDDPPWAQAFVVLAARPV